MNIYEGYEEDMDKRDVIREKFVEIQDLNATAIGAILNANVSDCIPVVTVMRINTQKINELMEKIEEEQMI